MRGLKLRSTRKPVPASANTPPSPHGSIATRLRWSYLLLSTLPVLIVGTLLLNISLSTQRSNVYGDQRSLASRTARSVAAYVDDLHRQFEAFETIYRPGSTTVDIWQSHAQDLLERNYPNISDFAVTDRSGAEVLRIIQLQTTPQDQLQSRGDEPEILAALSADTTTFSSIADENGAFFSLTMPLHNDAGTIIGAMQARISAAPIIEELHLSTEGTYSIAYLIRSDTGEVLLSDGRPNFTPPTDTEKLRAAVDTALEYIGARNQQVVGAVLPVVLGRTSLLTGWSVVVEQPSSYAFADLQRSAWVLALLVVLAGGLSLIWAIRQSERFLHPLAALRAGATAIGAGHLDHRIQASNNDELGDVAQAFNQMADHLQQSLDEIERQNERLRHGLALARDIQIGLLPDRAPWGNDELAVYARSIPAYEVGGDFYTYVALSEGRAAIAIGDISGKGVGAALLMSLTSSAVESHGRQLEHPAEVLSALNTLLTPRLKANHMNAALMFAVFDPREQKLIVSNAGMIAPVLIKPDGCELLEVGGLPIGSMANITYRELATTINPGDTLLLVSDGVVEAHNPAGELFGFDRLEEAVLDAQPYGDVRALVELVLGRVQEFMGGAEQHDDITLVAVRPSFTFDDLILEQKEQAVAYAAL